MGKIENCCQSSMAKNESYFNDLLFQKLMEIFEKIGMEIELK